MGLLDWLGGTVNKASQWIGEKARDFGQWIGEKVKPLLPTIKTISDGVSSAAGLADGLIPGAGLIRKGAEWISNNIGNGNIDNGLELLRNGSRVISGEDKSLKNVSKSYNKFNKKM